MRNHGLKPVSVEIGRWIVIGVLGFGLGYTLAALADLVLRVAQ